MRTQQAACQPNALPKLAPRRSSAPGLTVAVESFLTERGYEGSPHTVATYRCMLTPFVDYCASQGVTAFSGITADLIRDYLRFEAEAIRPRRNNAIAPARITRSTLQMRYTVLAVFLRWCVTEGKLRTYVMATVAKPRGESLLRHAFTHAECRLLLKTAKESPGILAHRDFAIVTVLLDTGARASELANLTWADVHWGGGEERGLGHIDVYGKGRKMRRLTLGTEARRALRRWSEVAPKIAGNWVWTSTRLRQLTAGGVLAVLKRLGEYAGVENVHTHRLRHTFAAEFTKQNRDVFATKARLGHAKVETTVGYLNSLGADYGADASYKTPGEWLK